MLVVFNSVLFQKTSIFILVCKAPMVMLLLFDISIDAIEMWLTHRKCAITILPVKSLTQWWNLFYPCWGSPFDLFYDGRNWILSRKIKQRVHMVTGAINNERLTIVWSQDGSKVTMHVILEVRLFEKWKAILCGEY